MPKNAEIGDYETSSWTICIPSALSRETEGHAREVWVESSL